MMMYHVKCLTGHGWSQAIDRRQHIQLENKIESVL